MKQSIVFLAVCMFLTMAAPAAVRGSLSPSAMHDVTVASTTVDLAKQTETVTLFEGPMPAKRDASGLSRLNLDLNDGTDYRIHQLLTGGGRYDIDFSENGGIASVSWHGSQGVVYAKPPVTRSQLQVGTLSDVRVNAITLDVAKNSALVSLGQQSMGCRGGVRCGDTGAALNLAFDLSNESDVKSYDLLQRAANQYGSFTLTFDGQGSLTSVQFVSWFIALDGQGHGH